MTEGDVAVLEVGKCYSGSTTTTAPHLQIEASISGGGNRRARAPGWKDNEMDSNVNTYIHIYILTGGTPRDHGRLPVDRTHQVSLCSAGLKAETHGKNINTQSICIVYHIAYVYGQDTQTTEIIETLTTWARGLFTPEIKEQKSRIENKNKPRLFFFFFA